jgi:cytoskeletal protein RodZ
MTEQQPGPTVSTAPADGASSATASPRDPLRSPRLPPHIGRLRTSTVLLTVAFLSIGLLYLFVKPPPEPVPGAGTSNTSNTSDTTPTSTAPRTTAATTTAPQTTEPDVEPTEPAPTSELPDDGTTQETVEPTTPDEGTAEPTATVPAPETAPPSS